VPDNEQITFFFKAFTREPFQRLNDFVRQIDPGLLFLIMTSYTKPNYFSAAPVVTEQSDQFRYELGVAIILKRRNRSADRAGIVQHRKQQLLSGVRAMFSQEMNGLPPALRRLVFITSDLHEYALSLFPVIVHHLSKQYPVGAFVQRILNLISGGFLALL
jgi:hypothetical protein